MWEAYRIGLCAGVGTALGLIAAGLVRRTGAGVLAGAVAAVLAGIVFGWIGEAIGGGAGGLLGGYGAAGIASGSLRRGGTAGGTAMLFVLAAIGVMVVSLIPLVGYLVAVALPVFAARSRRRAGEKYAGLRTLAK